MRAQHHKNDDAIQEAVHSWLQGDRMDFHHNRIFNLVQYWQKSVDHCGDIVQK